ncbi:hypothetical protein PC9H_001971 [Pleurotus ostreatus]|uniref:Aminoglycoside phosphotransferase domain-containing protein n=1 Tax=Pleurotus ostreatus TaxID=5322 RepID=A0A8H6ZJZ5_PLEOS|nr:uncharacterized protein PC9H_001971 [Pleurotus ostreatus]KAF7419382.1 hypothetical protein PC9H_001971 [Pleurotus ostreatus]
MVIVQSTEVVQSYNDILRHKERKVTFDVDGLCRLAAESVNQSLTDVVSLSKLAEGGFNRTFVVTLRDGRQVVARIPYPVTAPDYYAVASEIPAPKIYRYSTDSDNPAGTPYILMDFVQGSKLSDVWPSLSDHEVISIIHQLTQLESQMMSLSFPAGGSLYFTRDIEKVAPGLGIPLEDNRFCVGPDTKLALWYGRRTHLDVNRGPYHSAEEALAAAAHKEIAYLKQFGQPLKASRGFELLQSMGGDYESAVAFFKGWKEKALAEAESVEERDEIMAHWPWDDMDEEIYNQPSSSCCMILAGITPNSTNHMSQPVIVDKVNKTW